MAITLAWQREPLWPV